MSEYLSIDEAVNLLDISKQGFHKNRRAGKYLCKEVKVKGGISYEIALSSLPDFAQEKYRIQQANQAVANLPEPIKALVEKAETLPESVVKKDLSQYTEKQRDVDLAINTLMRWIKDYPGSATKAIAALNAGYQHGLLPGHIKLALKRSRIKKARETGSKDILSLSTYEKWVIRHKEQGNYVPLVRGKDTEMLPWYEMAVALYCRPQKPTFEWVTEQLALTFVPKPSYWAVRRFLVEKYSAGELNKGRNTGMQLKAKQYHRIRTSDGMLPWEEVHADGWKTHFTAPHPVTGEYVTFEIWDFHDVATRYVPPFAIGMTENYETIAKGIENAIRDQGVMAHLQTDSTKIIKNNTRFVGNPVLSILERAGITLVHPKTVGNAQANGIAENFHAWMDKQSRELTTYQGKKMDSLAFKRTQKLTAKLTKARNTHNEQDIAEISKQIAKVSSGILFESFEHACAWLEAKRQKWNHHAHSSLKRIQDPNTGRTRHQTPQEALDEFKANGWQPYAMSEELIIDLFRPRVQCRVYRGVVKPYGKMRFRHDELDHWEGKNVVVAYDIMDYNHVWVSEFNGSLICVASLDIACAHRAQTARDAAQEKRDLAQIRLRENQIETIKTRSGLEDNTVIEGEATRIPDIYMLEPEREVAPKISPMDFYADLPEPEAPAPKVTLDWSETEAIESAKKLSHAEGVMLLWGYQEDDEPEEGAQS